MFKKNMNRENHRQTFSPKQISGLGVVKTAHRSKLIKRNNTWFTILLIGFKIRCTTFIVKTPSHCNAILE
jgi:hypothetical protein